MQKPGTKPRTSLKKYDLLCNLRNAVLEKAIMQQKITISFGVTDSGFALPIFRVLVEIGSLGNKPNFQRRSIFLQ